jgi:hypothetical protein
MKINTIRNKKLGKIKKLIVEELLKDLNDFLPQEDKKPKKTHDEIIIDQNTIESILNSDNDDNWLGIYKPMRSPGIIVLNKRKIIELSKLIIKENLIIKPFNRNLKTNDIKRIGLMVTDMVLYHELFHYFCDVMIPFEQHKITNFIAIEEALANAFSFLCLTYEKSDWYYTSLNKYNFRALFFDKIKSVGYRDWVNYQKLDDFIENVIQYIKFDPEIIEYYKRCNNQYDQNFPFKNQVHFRFEIFMNSIVTNSDIDYRLT